MRIIQEISWNDQFQLSGGTVGQAGVSGRWRCLRRTRSIG